MPRTETENLIVTFDPIRRVGKLTGASAPDSEWLLDGAGSVSSRDTMGSTSGEQRTQCKEKKTLSCISCNFRRNTKLPRMEMGTLVATN